MDSSAAAAAPSPPAATASVIDAAWAKAVIAEQVEMTRELARIGLSIARGLERRVTPTDDAVADAPETAEPVDPADLAPEAPQVLDAVALSFARVSRAVRMTLVLQSELIRQLRMTSSTAAFEANQTAAARAADDARRAAAEEEQRRNLVGRIVWRVASAAEDDEGAETEGRETGEAGEHEYAERCEREAGEWLKDEDLYGDVAARPVSETVDRVCRDLGLTPDWPVLAEQSWARAELASGQVGAPLAAVQPHQWGRPDPKPPRPTEVWPRAG